MFITMLVLISCWSLKILLVFCVDNLWIYNSSTIDLEGENFSKSFPYIISFADTIFLEFYLGIVLGKLDAL